MADVSMMTSYCMADVCRASSAEAYVCALPLHNHSAQDLFFPLQARTGPYETSEFHAPPRIISTEEVRMDSDQSDSDDFGTSRWKR